MVILLVKFLEGGLKIGLVDYSWEMLLLPLSIIILAMTLKFMELNKPDKQELQQRLLLDTLSCTSIHSQCLSHFQLRTIGYF